MVREQPAFSQAVFCFDMIEKVVYNEKYDFKKERRDKVGRVDQTRTAEVHQIPWLGHQGSQQEMCMKAKIEQLELVKENKRKSGREPHRRPKHLIKGGK